MPAYRYRTVGVFTTVPLEGNPLAVFPDAAGLDTAAMQRIARELNLSETTFVTPPERGGTARVRIFTPGAEMPFAGHPTVGTAFVLRDEGHGGDALVLEENVGDVAVRVTHDEGVQFWYRSPAFTFGRQLERAAVAAALGLTVNALHPDAPPEFATVGPTFLYVALRHRDDVDRAALDPRALHAAHPDLPKLQVFVVAPLPESDGEPGDTYAVYARMFAEEFGIMEDPATGSATGVLPGYLIRHGLLPREDGLRLVSEQGTKMGRRSLLHVIVHVDGDALQVDVGGSVVPIAEATLTLPDA
jgi:trans-2,3-dihydro-3-hydroxyanthranilate isomerase